MISSRKFSQLKLSRRTVLKGAGGVAIALPWLEITSPHRSLRAAAAPARRFLAVYNPGGTVTDKWRPTGTETAFELSPILAPFLPVKKNILVLNGVDMPSARGEQNQCGMIAWLTGTGQAGFDLRGYAQGPSVDQVVANNVVAGPPMGSLSVAVRWGTGKTFGLTTPMGVVNFRETATFDPIKPLLDPVQIWKSLFGAVSADAHGNATWDRSILDAVGKRYAALARRLGAADRARMEQHLGKVREMEMQLAASQAARCSVPTLVDTSDYNPNTGLNSVSDGSVVDAATDAAIPKVGKLMMDMMVMAFACDQTRVGTLMWSDSEAKHTLPWLNLPGNQHHKFYQNDGGYNPAACEKIATWYSTQHSYLLQKMAAVDMGGHSLLDESVVFFGSHIRDPPTHKKDNMPFVLAGGGGGLRTGRWLTYDRVSHNDLLVSLLNLCGDTRKTFGDPAYCTGPLANLV